MAKVLIHEEDCKGCGLCTVACPKKILELDKDKLTEKGYNPAVCIDMESCIGCGMCAVICPDVVITIGD